MKEKRIKTNALRILEKERIIYHIKEVEWSDTPSVKNTSLEQVCKTIVLQGKTGQLLVCVVPLNAQLDLKKVAKISGEKSVALLPLEQLEKYTGYVRGGCSPIGMKKRLPTYFDTSVQSFETIAVSAGKKGWQMLVNTYELIRLTNGTVAELT